MKINSIEMVNFMGISGVYEIEMPHIAAILGPNGIGKTTVMNAIRFALTGAEPDGDIINKGAEQCRVGMSITDPKDGAEYTFERLKDRSKPSKCYINGKATTLKSMNEKIESVIGIALDKVKVLASSEVVASMKPQEFSSFILDYIPEKLGRDDIISLIPDTTMGMIDIIEANLPVEGIDLDIIDEFDSVCRQNRKRLKEELDRKKTLLETKPAEAPEVSKEDIEKQLSELANREADYRVYLTKKDAYEKAVESAKKHEEQMASLKAEIEAIKADRPDTVRYKALLEEEQSVKDSISNQNIAINSAKAAVRQMEISLENLSNPVCPLSDKIVCHQDKSAAKAELTDSIASSKEGITALEKELAKVEAKLEALEDEKKAYQDNYMKYDRKITLSKQYKSFEAAKPELPAKPDDMEEVDVAAEKETLQNQLKHLADYKEGVKLKAEVETLETVVKDYEALVKAIAEKGVVRTGIISRYVKVFEDICNERSSKVRPEITFEFTVQNGVVVLMDNGKGSKLPYASLSGGEKAYMIFIIMDMLNSLCGTNILFLDELSVIDTVCFDALLDIVLAYADDYDHILLAAVDHKDTVDSVTSRKIPLLPLMEKA